MSTTVFLAPHPSGEINRFCIMREGNIDALYARAPESIGGDARGALVCAWYTSATHPGDWNWCSAWTLREARLIVALLSDSATDKLSALLARCKCGVHLTVNQHRDYYESVVAKLAGDEDAKFLEPEVMAQMVATDTVVDLQFYPDTPIGSYRILHHSIEAALDVALACLARGEGR